MKVLKLKTHHFNKNLPCHKSMLTQVKRRVENGSQKKEGVLTVATLFYWKFCFSLRTYKELILCTNYPQMPIFILFLSAGVLFQGFFFQKQPPRGALSKRCFKNMQQIYWRTPMPKCDFNKVALQLYFGMVVLQYISSIFLEHLFLGAPLGECFCFSL